MKLAEVATLIAKSCKGLEKGELCSFRVFPALNPVEHAQLQWELLRWNLRIAVCGEVVVVGWYEVVGTTSKNSVSQGEYHG